MTGLHQFSQDAASNDVAAPPILWTEGMPANAVNNSARELMAALANFYADVGGGLIASGTISLSTNQGLDLSKSFEIAFRVDAANIGPVDLSVDGTAARPLTRTSGRPLGPGDLVAGPAYRVRWTVALNRYTVVSPAIEEAGVISATASATAPAGYLLCDGRAVSRTSYAALFAAIGTRWGAGDGTTTFNIPDLRGRALFGVDNMGGTPANRLTGTGGLDGALGDVGGNQVHTLTAAQMPSHGHTGTAASGGAHDHGGTTGNGGGHTHTGSTDGAGGHSHSGSAENGGDHSHTVKYTLFPNVVVSNSGGRIAAVVSIGAGETIGAVDLGGNYAHSVTSNAVGDHSHPLTINSVSGHTHTIADAAAHTHATPAIPAHTHTLTIDNAGSGGAYDSLDPGLAFHVATPSGRVLYSLSDLTSGAGIAALAARMDVDHDAAGYQRTALQDAHRFRQWNTFRTMRDGGSAAQMVINLIGDSWTQSVAYYVGVMRNALTNRYGDAGAGWIAFTAAQDGASVPVTGNVSSPSSRYDPTVARSGSWQQTIYGAATPDLGYIASSTAGDRITITVPGSTVHTGAKLCFIGGSGVVQFRWNAGAWTQLTLSGSGVGFLDLADVPGGAITLEIEVVSGLVQVSGVEFRSAANGVRINKLGTYGARAQNWAAADATGIQLGLTTFGAGLNFTLLGTNDQFAARTPAQFAADVSTMVDRIRAATPLADVCLVTPAENLRTTNAVPMAAYASAIRALARSRKCAFLDLQYAFGDDPTEYGQAGLQYLASDLIHPTVSPGGPAIADAFLAPLRAL